MPSVGEIIRWDIPDTCRYCQESLTDYTNDPQPGLRLKLKCNKCNHSWTLDPKLTERGLAEAIREKIERLTR